MLVTLVDYITYDYFSIMVIMDTNNILKITEILRKTGDTLESIWNQFEMFCPKCLHFKVCTLHIVALIPKSQIVMFSI